MNCLEAAELIRRYEGGTLPDELLHRLYLHLAECADCRTYLTCYRNAIRLPREERRASGVWLLQ